MKRNDIDENGVLVRWLRSRYGHQSLHIIIKNIAMQFLAAANQNKPPIHLHSLFGTRHVTDYSESKMVTNGRLLVDKAGFKIIVQNGYETRTRFTLAHEIAHTVFYDLESSPPKRLLHGARAKEEEHFCNMLAAEVLMPSWMIEDECNKFMVGNEYTSPITLFRQLARTFRVSLEALTRRVVEDLQTYKGIVLSTRWLPSVKSTIINKRSGPTWRLWWWAASPEVSKALYIPPANKRPKLGLDIIEQTFVRGMPISFQIQLANIRFGNLKKALGQVLGNSISTVEVWAHPILPEAVQLRSIIEDLDSSTTDEFTLTKLSAMDNVDTLARKRAEIILFFPLKIG